MLIQVEGSCDINWKRTDRNRIGRRAFNLKYRVIGAKTYHTTEGYAIGETSVLYAEANNVQYTKEDQGVPDFSFTESKTGLPINEVYSSSESATLKSYLKFRLASSLASAQVVFIGNIFVFN